MAANTALEGIVTALVTPLTPSGDVDAESLRNLVDVQIAAGVDAVFPLGTTGEVSYLATAQRAEVVEVVVDAADGRVPVIAGAVEMSSARVIDEAKAAIGAGADYIVATPPLYGDATDAELITHFSRIADAIDAPLIAYDIPFKTNRKIGPAVVERLAALQVIAGLKDSSGNFRQFREVVTELADSNVALLTGTEHMVDAALLMGASGAVLGLANVDPASFVEIYRAARDKDWDRARKAQERVVRLVQIMDVGVGHGMSFDSSIFGALKHVLVRDGIIASDRISSGTALPEPVASRIDQIVDTVRETSPDGSR